VAFTHEGPLAAPLREAGRPLHRLDTPRLTHPRAVVALARLVALARRDGVDVVHCHDIYSNIAVVPLMRAAGLPVIASRRWGARHYSLRLTRANRLAYRVATRVLGNSEQVGRSLVVDDGVDPARVVVVPNFVDDDLFDLEPSPEASALRARLLAETGAERVVGMVARLAAVKEPSLLLRAVAQLGEAVPRTAIAFIGDGPERQALEAMSRELGMEGRVRFLGGIPRAQSLHRAFDVSVLTSTSEGFPNTLVEAMAGGVPVVATAVGGVPDTVIDDVTGLLVAAGDVVGLSDRLSRVLTDPVLAARLAGAGREHALQRHAPQRVLPHLVRLYALLAGDPSSSP
jgi:glycosyltransferase involved in cell wall biosynthesis